MVQGLIEYNKLQFPLELRGLDEEFEFTPEVKSNMKNWNPLLVAIAFKKIDIVRYLLNELNISLKMGGWNPDSQEGADMAEAECFALKIAVKNKDH